MLTISVLRVRPTVMGFAQFHFQSSKSPHVHKGHAYILWLLLHPLSFSDYIVMHSYLCMQGYMCRNGILLRTEVLKMAT